MKKKYTFLLFVNVFILFTSTVFSQESETTISDVNGNEYPYKKFFDNIWTLKNANMVSFTDGTPIPEVTDNEKWKKMKTAAWCYYNNDPNTGEKLYNWYAVAGIYDENSLKDPTLRKKLAPAGWHIPTDKEWSSLKSYTAVDLASKKGWQKSDNNSAPGFLMNNNNKSGFNAFPSGQRFTIHSGGIFYAKGTSAAFWTSTINQSNSSGWFYVYYYHIGSNSNKLVSNSYTAVEGMSVRFVKDN